MKFLAYLPGSYDEFYKHCMAIFNILEETDKSDFRFTLIDPMKDEVELENDFDLASMYRMSVAAS